MMSLLTHIKTDPNAPMHQILGAMACVAGLASFGWLGAITAPLIVGISIELVQRVQRRGKSQNTIKESILDTLTTWLWWIAPLGWRS